jgi:hypothetical protein
MAPTVCLVFRQERSDCNKEDDPLLVCTTAVPEVWGMSSSSTQNQRQFSCAVWGTNCIVVRGIWHVLVCRTLSVSKVHKFLFHQNKCFLLGYKTFFRYFFPRLIPILHADLSMLILGLSQLRRFIRSLASTNDTVYVHTITNTRPSSSHS